MKNLHLYPDCEKCPICDGKISGDGNTTTKFFHTSMGTITVQATYFRCRTFSRIEGGRKRMCDTRIHFKYYLQNNKKYIIKRKPKIIQVGKNHLFDVYFLEKFVLGQFFNGNGLHLMSQASKISANAEGIPDLKSYLTGAKKVSPTVGENVLQDAMKWYYFLRYMNCTSQSISVEFTSKDDISEMIQKIQQYTIQFSLSSHLPSVTYRCNSRLFIMDGTQKINFRICTKYGCSNKPKDPRHSFCEKHSHLETSTSSKVYTGGLYNIICECGCPIGMRIYEGGESYIGMLSFAEQILRQKGIESANNCTLVYDRSDDLLKHIYSLKDSSDENVRKNNDVDYTNI